MKNTLSSQFDSLIQKWEKACLADFDLNEKTNIANEIIDFYKTNSTKLHFLEKDLKLIEEINMFLFFYYK